MIKTTPPQHVMYFDFTTLTSLLSKLLPIIMGQSASQQGSDPTTEYCQSDDLTYHHSRKMTNHQKLEALYNDKVKLDEMEEKKYRGILNYLVDVVVRKMKETDPAMAELYRETYWGGSFFDGLKVGSTDQEFDLNIVFRWNPNGCSIVKVGQDRTRRNFAWVKVTKPSLTQSERRIVFENQGEAFISPLKMFNLLKSSIDRVLTGLDLTLNYQGNTFRVTRHEYAPVTLVCSGTGIFFEVDFVPSLKFDFRSLPAEITRRVTNITSQYNGTADTFMAISLHKADKQKFKLDFHDLEREILYNRGCVKKVIKLIKYLRDMKGGPMLKLWSHLIKTSTMNLVMKKPESFWNNGNLVNCFLESLTFLTAGLERDSVQDVFFPELNLLDRIKNKQIITDVTRHLKRKIARYQETDDIMDIFN